MSAFKIKHKKTGKFLSTTASSRYLVLYFEGAYKYSVEDALTTKGRVYSTERGAQNTLDKLEKYPSAKGQFELHKLK